MSLPLYKNLSLPILKALRKLGDTASVKEIENKTADLLNLNEKDRTVTRVGNQTKLHNRVAWASYNLKTKGYIENIDSDTYRLTRKGKDVVSGLH